MDVRSWTTDQLDVPVCQIPVLGDGKEIFVPVLLCLRALYEEQLKEIRLVSAICMECRLNREDAIARIDIMNYEVHHDITSHT